MSDRITVGELVALFLERCRVSTAFGVISIHNMPILDAIGRRGVIRFVPARGEAGACNMADAHARVSGSLGVCVTSTGTAAGNAAGAMVEAQSAGTPLLHLTGQIETAFLDQDRGYIHEARDQLGMLRAISKTAFRVASAGTALATLKDAVHRAMMPPAGPVSVEIPIDIQEELVDRPADLSPLPVQPPAPSEAALDGLAEQLVRARRPLIWLGGGARHAGRAVQQLADLGIGIVTSTQGRGILPENDTRTLGAFNMQGPVEALYASCDAMLVAGSRLRGNETLKYTLSLPRPLYQIDVSAGADGRSYPADLFVRGDAALALEGLALRLSGRLDIDPHFAADIRTARAAAEQQLREGLGPYELLADATQQVAGSGFVWVRDVTLSNSTWGNRLLKLYGPRDGVHALGGGIGQGLAMGVGAALAAEGRKTLCLVGDGGFQLNQGELATAAQERADLAILLMNSGGYGVIKNIQDARFEGRQYYSDLLTPEFGQVCAAVGIPHQRLTTLDGAAAALASAVATPGPALVEVDMAAVGDFARPFAGPPVRTRPMEPAQ